MKRGWPSGSANLLLRRCAIADALRQELQDLYSGVPKSFIWDMTTVLQLVRPEHAGDKYYRYVGRAQAEVLYEKISALKAGHRLQVLGAKGSGKSTAVATVAAYLISGAKEVVYLCAKRFLRNPFMVLLDALLVACGQDSTLLAVSGLDDLLAWCMEHPGPLMFVVDDWDQFENAPDLEQKLEGSIMDHILVKVSSVNSIERQNWNQSDKSDDDIVTVLFDGPYSSVELATWLGRSTLPKEKLQNLDRLTGGMPRLVRCYEEVEADEIAFMDKIKEAYTDKLFTGFIGRLGNRDEVRAALELILLGRLPPILTGKVDFTCLYKDGRRFRVLSPYLRHQAEEFIMQQHKMLANTLILNDVQTWAQVVRRDCIVESARNPARIGWNVEGLVISVIKFQQQLFSFSFQTYKTYPRGQEVDVLELLTQDELKGGVLLGPEAFNEKAVDLIYIILEERGRLKIKAVQITIAQWKAKAKKESHRVWKDELLPKWTEGLKDYNVDSEYYYIMPESVTLEDVPPDTTGFKRFGDIHECLKQFDRLLQLPEPAACHKPALQQCSFVRENGERCKNHARSEDQQFKCYRHRTYVAS